MTRFENLTRGFIKENPIFVLVLGGCPTLATTTSAINGCAMGLATTFVLLFANIVVSLIANATPDKVRIPAFIIVIAAMVTVVDLLMQAYTPELYKQLGIFIPLIVANCILLGRAEAFASKNNVLQSSFDGLGMGLGFTMALTLIGFLRELLGTCSVLGYKIIPGDGILIFVLAPGAFIVLGYVIAAINKIRKTEARTPHS